MDSITLLGWILLLFSSTASVVNIAILLHLLSKKKDAIADKVSNLSAKEFELLQRQYIFLQAKSDINLKRLDAHEKVLSALIISNQFDDTGGNGIMH